MESDMNGPHSLVPIPYSQAARTIDHKGYDGKDAERPGQAEVGDHSIGRKGVREATEPRPARRDGIGERTALVEPLRHQAHGGCEAEAQAEPETYALAQDQVRYVGGEGSADEGDSELGVNRPVHNGAQEKGLRF